jgi:hypothetical protein
MNKINLEDREKGMYQFYLDQKDNNITNVLKYIFLRKDFYELLDEVYNNSFIFRKTPNSPKKKVWDYDDKKFQVIIEDYIKKLEKTKLCKDMSDKELSNFRSTVIHFIHFTYTIHFSNVKNNSGIFKGQIVLDSMDNYPTLSHNCFNADSFYEVFKNAFYSKKSFASFENKDKKHPTLTTTSLMPTIDEKFMAEEKVVQLLINEGTGKQALLDYIEKNWYEIEGYLIGGRPELKETKSKADKKLLRDIDIYNKYQEYIEKGEKNPDTKTMSWLEKDSKYKLELEPNTISKIVSGLNTEIEEINSEK